MRSQSVLPPSSDPHLCVIAACAVSQCCLHHLTHTYAWLQHAQSVSAASIIWPTPMRDCSMRSQSVLSPSSDPHLCVIAACAVSQCCLHHLTHTYAWLQHAQSVSAVSIIWPTPMRDCSMRSQSVLSPSSDPHICVIAACAVSQCCLHHLTHTYAWLQQVKQVSHTPWVNACN